MEFVQVCKVWRKFLFLMGEDHMFGSSFPDINPALKEKNHFHFFKNMKLKIDLDGIKVMRSK